MNFLVFYRSYSQKFYAKTRFTWIGSLGSRIQGSLAVESIRRTVNLHTPITTQSIPFTLFLSLPPQIREPPNNARKVTVCKLAPLSTTQPFFHHQQLLQKDFVERQDIGNTKNKKSTVVGFLTFYMGRWRKRKNKGLGL